MKVLLRKGAAIRTIGFLLVLLLLAGSFGDGQTVYGLGYRCGGWIESGDIVYDSVPSSGYGCTYYFKGYRYDKVLIQMTKRSYSLDPYLTLYDPYGRKVAVDDDSGGNGNSEIYYSLPRTGTYELVAGSYQSASSGQFKLSLDRW